MGLEKHENGYYYIRVQQDGQLIKFSTRTKDKNFAEDLYQEFLRQLISNRISGKLSNKTNNQTREIEFIQGPSGDIGTEKKPIQGVIEDYIHAGELKKYTKYTIGFRKRLFGFCKRSDIYFFSDFTQKKLNVFFESIKTLAEDTQDKYVKTVKAFLNYAIRKGFFDETTYKRLDFPHFESKTRDTTIPPEDITKIYASLEYKDEKNTGDLDMQFYLKILYYTVCRPSEIIHLRKRDFDFKNKRIEIFQNKVKKSKIIYFTDEFIAEIQDFISTADDYVFKGHFAGKEYYSKKFSKLRNKLEMPKEYKLYTFRHTRGTELMDSTNDLEFVSKSLGHQNIKTTAEHYINRDDTQYRELMDRVEQSGKEGRKK